MSIITLITDFGIRDHSVAAIKAGLLTQLENPTIVDISHAISPYNVVEAAYILKAVYTDFPKNTIHIIGVNATRTPLHKHLIVQLNDHYFIGADTGLFSLLLGTDSFEKIISFKHPKAATSIFPTKDVFVDIAARISKGEAIENIGTPITSIKKWKTSKPNISRADELIGRVIYIDHFGNLVTDISNEIFKQTGKGRAFNIVVGRIKINKIYANYEAIINYKLPTSKRAKAGLSMAVFNANGLLEIALYKSDINTGGTAHSLLGLRVGDSIKMVFE